MMVLFQQQKGRGIKLQRAWWAGWSSLRKGNGINRVTTQQKDKRTKIQNTQDRGPEAETCGVAPTPEL